MCERTRSSVLAGVVSLAGALVGTRAGRVGLVVASLAVAGYLWPLVVGVAGGVLVGVAVVAYVLGASRERPLLVRRADERQSASPHMHTPAPQAVAEPSDAVRVAALERELADTRALAMQAVRALEASHGRVALPVDERRVLSAYRWLDEEG